MKHVANASGEPVQLETVRLPYISLHAFCENQGALDEFSKAAQDRRMGRVKCQVHLGGVDAAIRLYESTPTPNLIVLETSASGETLLAELDRLAGVCDPETKVLVVGYTNDIPLYRALLDRGISDYLIGPVDGMSLITRISRVFAGPTSARLGRSFAFIGAKGGVGSSAVAQNVASAVARQTALNVVLADLDLPFGGSSLNLDLEERSGTADAVLDPGRLDHVLLERLLAPYESNLNVLSAPAALERTYDLEPDCFDRLLDIAQANIPYLILDVPHLWTAAIRKLLIAADEVVVTATPDLVSLRNSKQLLEFLKAARPNDGAPKLLLNQVGVPKRQEIKPKEFAHAVGVEPAAVIPFDAASFSGGSIKGKMIADVSAKSAASKVFADLSRMLVGRSGHTPRKRSFTSLFTGRGKRV